MSLPAILGEVWIEPNGLENKIQVVNGNSVTVLRNDGHTFTVDWDKFSAKARRKGELPPKPKLAIEPGSVVQLKSGGFYMTVCNTRPGLGELDTVWTTWMNDDGDIKTGSFASNLLQLKEPQ